MQKGVHCIFPLFGFVFTIFKTGRAVNNCCEYKLKNITGKAVLYLQTDFLLSYVM